MVRLADITRTEEQLDAELKRLQLGLPEPQEVALRNGSKVWLRVLSEAETGQADLSANLRAEKSGLDGDAKTSLASAAKWTDIISKAWVDPSGRPMFIDPGQLKSKVPETTIGLLIIGYHEAASNVQSEIDEEVAEHLRKKDWSQLRAIVPMMPFGSLLTTASQLLDFLQSESLPTGSSLDPQTTE